MSRVIDLVTLLAYSFAEDSFHQNAENFFNWAEEEKIELLVIETVISEAEAVYLAGKIPVSSEDWIAFIDDIFSSPILKRVMLDNVIFREHLDLYRGWEKGQLSYFDSFHGALAKTRAIPLVTTDKMLLKESSIPTEDLRKY